VRWSSEGQLTKEKEAAVNKKAATGEKEVVTPISLLTVTTATGPMGDLMGSSPAL
jgi:translation elongation factor EF-G